MEKLLSSGRQKAILGRNGPKNPPSSQETYLDSMEETDNKGTKPCETWNRSRKSLEEFCQRKRSLVEFGTIAHESSYQERPFCKIRPVLSPLYGDPLMKRPLRYRTMGAVREGRGNPSPYSILFSVEKSDNYSFFLIEVLSSRAFDQNFLHVLTFRSGIEAQFFLLTSLLFL